MSEVINKSKNFAIIGVGGYIAPRHMQAIKDTGNNLIAALDINDSVGIIDQYFPNCSFFTEFERFDRYVEKLKRQNQIIDYFVICSPNYLHDAHIRFGLKHGADVICEKPLVLNTWNIDGLLDLERETGKKVYTILQLRLHPKIISLKSEITNSAKNKFFEVELTYISARGNWYYTSWKGDISKSGGIAMNIGIHFFDMLIWIFGEVKENIVNLHSHDRAAGVLSFENAKVKWFLSINEDTLPIAIKDLNKRTYRNIIINNESFEFSEGFTNLHTMCYNDILNKKGSCLIDSKLSIELVHQIRIATPIGIIGEHHSFCNLSQSMHPFNCK